MGRGRVGRKGRMVRRRGEGRVEEGERRGGKERVAGEEGREQRREGKGG